MRFFVVTVYVKLHCNVDKLGAYRQQRNARAVFFGLYQKYRCRRGIVRIAVDLYVYRVRL